MRKREQTGEEKRLDFDRSRERAVAATASRRGVERRAAPHRTPARDFTFAAPGENDHTINIGCTVNLRTTHRFQIVSHVITSFRTFARWTWFSARIKWPRRVRADDHGVLRGSRSYLVYDATIATFTKNTSSADHFAMTDIFTSNKPNVISQRAQRNLL